MPSVDIDLSMKVLLGLSCGRIVPLGEGAMNVTVRQVVSGGTRHLLVSRVYRLRCHLQDGSECPQTSLGAGVRMTPQRCLFVLVYLWSGFDFLPAVSHQPFLNTWEYAVESGRSSGLLAKSIFDEENRMWTVDLSEGVNLLVRSLFFQHKAAFKRAKTESPPKILPHDGNVEQYVRKILALMFTLGKGKPTNCCPLFPHVAGQARRQDAKCGVQ